MAVKTYYLGSGQDGNFGALFDGAAQTAASRADGWTVAKIASTNASDFDAATKQTSGTFAAASGKPSALITSAIANALKTPAALTGTFANTAWTFSFAVRAVTLSAQAGRMRMRVYKSVNASGASATEITGATQIGTTSTVLSTSADVLTTVTWSPGATIDLNNEYLFFVIAWEITTASGSNSGDVVLRTGSTGPAGTRLVTPDFALPQTLPIGKRAAATTVRGVTLAATGAAPITIGRRAAATTARGITLSGTGSAAPFSIGRVSGGLSASVGTSAAYSARILSLAPLAYYRFGEPSGTTANDSSGNGRHATYVGSPALGQPGPFGSNTAVLLDGVDDRIVVPSSVVIPAGSSITVEWWGKVNTADLTDAKIFEFGSGTSPDAITGYAPWSDAVAYWDYGDAASGSGRVSTYYNSCLNKWALFHYTFDATTGRHSISINGLEIVAAINANAPTISSAGGVIGCGADLSWKFKGIIDEFVIYDKALTPAQRIATYRTAFPDTAPVTDYVNRWDAQWPSVIVQHPWGGPTGWQWWGNASGNDDFRMEGGQFNGYYVPEYAKYQLGGIDVPSFDGTDNEYSTWNRPTMPATQTWFVVGQIDATTGVANLVSCGRFGPSFYLNDGKPVWGDHWNVDPVFTHPNSVVANKPFIAGFGYDGSTANLRLNGVQATASFSRGSWTPDAAFLTGAPPAGQTLRIGEIVMFDRVLSASEVSAVEAWLSAKWVTSPGTSVVRGVTFVLPPATLSVGAKASATTVRGITLAPSPVTVTIGTKAAATSVKGVTLAPGLVTVPIGKVGGVGSTVLDNFNRADNASLGANWSMTNFILDDPEIVSNRAAISASAGETTAYWNGTQYPVNQECSFPIYGWAAGYSLYLLLNVDNTLDNCYLASLDDSGSFTYAVTIYRRNGGSWSTVGSYGTAYPALSDGDTVGFRHTGGSLEVLKNGVSLGVITDGSPLTNPGYVGFGGRNASNLRIDNFSVGGGASATAVRGITLAPGPVTITIGRRAAATAVRGVTLAPGPVTFSIGRRTAATAVSGVTFVLPPQFVPIGWVPPLGAYGANGYGEEAYGGQTVYGITLLATYVVVVGRRASATAVRGITLVPGPVIVIIGTRAAATAVRGVTLVPSPVALPIGKRVAATSVRGVTLAPGPVTVLIGAKASATSVKGVTLTGTGTTSLTIGQRVVATTTRGVTLAATGAATLLIGAKASATTVRGATLTPAGVAPLTVGKRPSSTTVRGVTLFAAGSAPLSIGTKASTTVTRGVTLLSGITLLPVGRAAATGAVRGVTVTGTGFAAVPVGRRAVATTVRGVTLLSGLAVLTIGRRAAATAVSGVALLGTGTAAPLLIGRRAAATTVRGVTLASGVAGLVVGKRAAATAVRGVTLTGTGTATFTIGRRASVTVARGLLIVPGIVSLPIGQRASQTLTRGLTIIGSGIAPLAVGMCAAATVVRGATVTGTGTAFVTIGYRASTAVVYGITLATFGVTYTISALVDTWQEGAVILGVSPLNGTISVQGFSVAAPRITGVGFAEDEEVQSLVPDHPHLTGVS